MFRKMRRFNQQVPKEKCIEVLKNEWRGVLAVLGDEGYPYTVPLDFFYDEAEEKIYFHGAKEGHKVDAISKCNKVSFCVMDKGFKKEGDWALNITSVIVFGRLHPVKNLEKALEKTLLLGLKYNPSAQDVEKELEGAKNRLLCLELEIEHISGKLVCEK